MSPRLLCAWPSLHCIFCNWEMITVSEADIVILIFQVRKLKHGELQIFAQSHIVRKSGFRFCTFLPSNNHNVYNQHSLRVGTFTLDEEAIIWA